MAKALTDIGRCLGNTREPFQWRYLGFERVRLARRTTTGQSRYHEIIQVAKLSCVN